MTTAYIELSIEVPQAIATTPDPDPLAPVSTPLDSYVRTFNARTGAVVPVAGDYLSSEVTDDSGVGGATVDASLDILDAAKLGLATIGTTVQAWDANLDQIAALTPTDSNFVVGNGSAWVAESGATARTSLGLAIGTDVQAWDAALDDISGLAVTDGNIIVGDGANWVAESGATARTSLGLGSMATQESNNVSVTGGTITGVTYDTQVFDTAITPPSHAEGTVYWDPDDHTLALMTDVSGTVIQVGQETIFKVVNQVDEANSLSNGEVVYISGAQGNRPAVKRADADLANSHKTIGVVTSSSGIGYGQEGYVTVRGVVRGINTSGWSAGADLYLSQTAGAITATEPTYPAHSIHIGHALNSTVNGSIMVSINEGMTFDDVHGCTISGLASGDLIQYDGSAWGNVSSIDAGMVTLARITGSTYSTAQHLQDIFHSTGVTSGGGITDDGDGTITVAAGTGLLRATDSRVAEILFADWASESGAGVALADNDMNYIYVNYVDPSTTSVTATTTKSTDLNTKIFLGSVYRSGTTLHITENTRPLVGDHALQMIERLKAVAPFARESGGVIGETGTRNITVTAGAFWEGLTRFTTAAFNSSSNHSITAVNITTDTFTVAGDQTSIYVAGKKFRVSGSTGNDGEYTVVSSAYTTSTEISVSEDITNATVDGAIYYQTFVSYYYTGAAWATTVSTFDNQFQIDNTNYNDVASGLVALTASRYGVHWIYLDGEGEVYTVYGTGDYTLAQAEDVGTPASVPPHFEESHAKLIGKIVIQKSASSFTDVVSLFDTMLSSSSAADHNALSSLQGGTSAEYYHLTSAQHTKLTATQYKTIYIDAAAMVPSGTNGAAAASEESSTYDVMNEGFDFDAATDEFVQFKLMMPDEWNRSTVKVKIFWKDAVVAGTGNVMWGVQGQALGDSDVIDSAWGTAQIFSDSFITSGDLHVTSASSAITIGGSPSLGDMIYFRIYRDANHASDTYTQDARLLGVAIQYAELTTAPSAW